MEWTQDVEQALTRHGRWPAAADARDLATREVVEEWAQHAASAFAAARAEGLSEADARARVAAVIDAWAAGIDGPPRRLMRATAVHPPAAAAAGLTGWWHDVVYALRLLRKQPGFAVVALLTTALAVGATTTLFSVADGVLGKPLPYPSPDRLVRLTETREGATRQLPQLMTHVTYQMWRQAPDTIDAVAGFRVATMNVGAAGAVERLRGIRATASWFDVFGVRAERGAVFTEADEAPGRPPVMVITRRLWRDRFGLADDVVGRSLELDGRMYQVVGVIADRVIFPDPELQFILPLTMPPAVVDPNGGSSITLVGGVARLKAGVTEAQAGAEASARAQAGPPTGMVDTALWGSRGARVVDAVSLVESVTGEVRPAILVFLGAVGLLFLTAVSNISSLQLARASARRREFAIRAAIGAGLGRLSRQLLMESLVVGLLGGALGVLVALGLHQALPTLLPADFPRASDVVMDLRVLAFAGAMSIAAGALFGLLPVWQVRKVRLVDALLEDGQAPAGLSRRTPVGRLRVAIMVGQVAVAAVLLVGAGVLGRTFAALWTIDRGYNPTHVLTARLPMPDHAFTGTQRAEVMDRLLSRVRGVGGVQAAGYSTILPLSGSESLMGFTFQRRSDGETINAQAAGRSVSDDYFAALGATIVAGRGITAADTLAAPPVVVVNETFARTYLDGQAVGAQVPVTADPDREASEVVGVVRDIQPQVRGEAPRPEVYFAARQRPAGLEFPEPSLVVRTAGDPSSLIPVVRGLAAEVDGRVALDSVLTMEDRLMAGLARPRLYAVLLTGLSALALLIAGVGVFGVLSYNVTQRRREIGVRAALGARPAHIVRMTVGQGVWITVAGLVIGLGLAAFAVRFLRDLVWGVAPLDPISFAAVPVVLLLVAVAACWWPARRAARIDPLTALK